MTLNRRSFALSLTTVLVGTPAVLAGPTDWTSTVLTPAGHKHATAYGIGGGVIVGEQGQGTSTTPRATIWTSMSPAGAVDITPAGAAQSNVIATTGSQHVGNVVIGGVRRAGVWNGTAFTSLHPAGYSVTYAQGTDGTHQSGLGTTAGGVDRALLWSGTPTSAVVLNPAGSSGAAAYAMGGGREVGWATFGLTSSLPVAGFWSGTAESWTKLGAPGQFARRDSVAVAISPDGQTQAGYVVGDTGTNWAVLWHSTPESFTLLNPTDYFGTSVLAADDQFQVGWGIKPGGPRVAALWSGTADSLVDLSTVLPSGYTSSQAYGVRSAGADVWVVGSAYNPATDTSDAIVWHATIPGPGAAVSLLAGLSGLARRRRGGA